MNIAFQTLACPDWSWEKMIGEARRLGYDGIEPRGIEGEMYLPKARPFLPENLDRTKIQLKEASIRICCLDTGCVFHDPVRYGKAVIEGKETIDLAEKLEVPYIRVFGDIIPDRAREAETVSRVAEGVDLLGRYAEGKGVTVLLETHGDFNNYRVISSVMDRTGSPVVGLLWDFEHPFMHGEEPEVTHRQLARYIRHTHVKDARFEHGEKVLTMIGEGEVPVRNIVRLLTEGGYTGWLSLEFEKKWKPHLAEPDVSLPAFIRYIREALQAAKQPRPSGEGSGEL